MFDASRYLWILPLALIIPVLIHLLIRRKKIVLYLPTVKFLFYVKEQKRKSKLEDLLNLFLRIGVLTLLTFLFSLPYCSKGEKITVSNVMFIFDTSPSMEACDFKTLKSMVKLAFKIAKDNKNVEVMSCSNFLRKIKEGQIKSSLRGFSLEDPSACIESSGFTKIIFVSDFRGEGWKNFSEKVSLDASDYENYKIAFVPFKNCSDKNYWITSVETIKETDKVKLTVRGKFKKIKPSVVELFTSNNKEITKLTPVIEDKLNFHANFFLKYPLESSQIYAHLKDMDGIHSDNYFYLLLKDKKINGDIYVINGESSEISYYDEAYYTINALRTDPELWDRTRMIYDWKELQDEGKVPSVLLILNKSFGESQKKLFKDILTNSGRIIFAPGDNLKDRKNTFRILGIESAGVKVFTEPAHPRLTVRGQDLFNPSEKYINLMFRVKVNYAFELIPEKKEEEILIASEEGSPLLIKSKVGGGDIFLFSFPLDIEWSDFPLHPVFVPLLLSIVKGEFIKFKNKVPFYKQEKPGFHKGNEGNSYVVNPDIRDSSLDRVKPQVFARAMGDKAKVIDFEKALSFFAEEEKKKHIVDLPLIFSVLFLFVLEILLSTYFEGKEK